MAEEDARAERGSPLHARRPVPASSLCRINLGRMNLGGTNPLGSQLGARQPGGRWRAWRALLPLLFGAGLLAPACLLPKLPDPVDKQAERPNVNYDGSQPPVYQVLSAQRGGAAIDITVPFTSVDAGEDISWVLWSNWNLEGGFDIEDGNLPAAAATNESTGIGGAGAPIERSVQYTWSPDERIKSGCSQLTLFITHRGNFDSDRDRPIDLSQAAAVTWWVNLDAPLDSQQTLEDCPVNTAGPLSSD